MTQTPPPLCELRQVSHSFPQAKGQLTVLHDVSLEVRPREVVALLGPSGCGKSTLLRILAGLIRPSSGQVLYHGAPLQGLNPGVAMVFQSFALYPWMTVRQNIETVLEAASVPAQQRMERALAAVRTVGLAGFEEAYPRQMSGGMKQRAGMARAFSLEPEMLFMDEPFSQVDALTAESLRAEVLDVWAQRPQNPSSILMVSHDIKEVAFMADRIVVLGAHPGVVRTVVNNPLPRPRDYRSPDLLQLVDRLHDIITGSELPDQPRPELAPEPIEALPRVTVSEVMGLLEYLDARQGHEDVFRIATDTDREFGAVLRVVQAAEILDLVDTPKRQVVLVDAGAQLLRALPAQRRERWRTQVLRLGLFRRVVTALERQPDRQLRKSLVLELILMTLPSEDPERTFETLLRWGRFGGLFEYAPRREVLRLVE
jgi:NitT/TauT family transport system ATP-binding protein